VSAEFKLLLLRCCWVVVFPLSPAVLNPNKYILELFKTYSSASRIKTRMPKKTDPQQKKVRVQVKVVEYFDYDYDLFCEQCVKRFDISDKKVIDELWEKLTQRKKVDFGWMIPYELADPDPMIEMLGDLVKSMMKK